jgi:hypothetical protein
MRLLDYWLLYEAAALPPSLHLSPIVRLLLHNAYYAGAIAEMAIEDELREKARLYDEAVRATWVDDA